MAQKPFAQDVKGNYWTVDSRRLIEEEGFNRRENYGDIKGLAASIKAFGVDTLDPLWCYKKGENWVVIKGHRRRRALKMLESEGEIIMVRIMMLPKGFNREMLILDQVTGNDGLNFTPWEKAKVVRDLRGLGWSLKDMVDRSKLSSVYVKRLLSLADAPQRLINLVRDDVVRGTLAMDALAEGDEAVEALIAKGEKGDASMQKVGGTLFPSEKAPLEAQRITKSDLKPNSWKIFRKISKKIDENELSPAKAEIFQWLKKMEGGELTEEDIQNFFL